MDKQPGLAPKLYSAVFTLGNFRMFFFEHLLKPSSSAPNIKILGEHNIRIAMQLVTKRSWVTDEKAIQDYVTY